MRTTSITATVFQLVRYEALIVIDTERCWLCCLVLPLGEVYLAHGAVLLQPPDRPAQVTPAHNLWAKGVGSAVR